MTGHDEVPLQSFLRCLRHRSRPGIAPATPPVGTPVTAQGLNDHGGPTAHADERYGDERPWHWQRPRLWVHGTGSGHGCGAGGAVGGQGDGQNCGVGRAAGWAVTFGTSEALPCGVLGLEPINLMPTTCSEARLRSDIENGQLPLCGHYAQTLSTSPNDSCCGSTVPTTIAPSAADHTCSSSCIWLNGSTTWSSLPSLVCSHEGLTWPPPNTTVGGNDVGKGPAE